ncbi:MAG: type I asparaginase [Prevotellaceae bacterium]|jgi:L-asparaginase|nr:type I asparaginase [Prevotellaceae bacterium]
MKKKSVLLIFTGGTISMGENPADRSLSPLNSGQVLANIPELNYLDVKISSDSFSPLIDSSDMQPENWVKICELIAENYENFDGFVVLHGTDTMSYSASAVSFMLENLSKPVIFTGAQLPVGVHRSDAKENLITAIEIAAAKNAKGDAIIQEVCLYFEEQLMRGNRTTKRNAEEFDAFASFNYPLLAKAGVHIKYFPEYCHYEKKKELKININLDNNIAILKIFAGINYNYVKNVLSTENLRAVIIETFGAGNAPTCEWLAELLTGANRRGIILFNVTQCRAGSVEMGRYATSHQLRRAGVISGRDITTEAAVAKLMFLLGQNTDNEQIKELLKVSLRGEMTVELRPKS